MQQLPLNLPLADNYNLEDLIVSPHNRQALAFLLPQFQRATTAEQVQEPTPITLLQGPAKSGKTLLATAFAQRYNAIMLDLKALPSSLSLRSLVQKHPALVIEDIEAIKEKEQELLFHLYNLVQEKYQPEDQVKTTAAESSVDFNLSQEANLFQYLDKAGLSPSAGLSVTTLAHQPQIGNTLKPPTYLLLTSKLPPAMLPAGLADLKSRLINTPLLSIEEPGDNIKLQLLFKALTDVQLSVSLQVVNYIFTRAPRNLEFYYEFAHKLYKHLNASKKPATLANIKPVLGTMLEEC